MDEPIWFSGIDPDTGTYVFPPTSIQELAATARQNPIQRVRHRDLRELLDPRDLAQAGWGILFAAEDEQAPEIREALGALLEHRRSQAALRYREFLGEDGLRPGESLTRFLSRHHATPGVADPEHLPYYLLLVGSPKLIPYSFQHLLDLTYAVGRIHFETLEEYGRYARSVVDAEKGSAPKNPRAVFFGPRNSNDRPTEQSADHLVRPLAGALEPKAQGWLVETVLGEDATRSRLSRLLGGEEKPAFLFTASHGILYSPGDPRQRPRQGALVCQDWPGPGNPARPDFCFGAEDLDPSAQLSGLVTFHFACFSAGTPFEDEFVPLAAGRRKASAPEPFLASLSQRLLANPGGGALAVIGHVDRAWQWSFLWPGAGKTLQTFEDMILRLFQGYPVGAAMEHFSRRYADLSALLCNALQDSFGDDEADEELAFLWCASNDARNYVVIGDPAVRIVPPPTQPPGDVESKTVPIGDARAKGGALLYRASDD